ncbi:mycothione reductase [Dermabacteraceae bacterium P7054]
MTHYDMLIIGTGSGNSLLGPEFSDKKIALVEKSVFGGTCLNVGCIPTKMFVYTADLAATPAESARFGVDETLDGVRWADIRDRVFGRIDPIAASGEEYRTTHPDNDNVTVYRGTARFTAEKTVSVALNDGGTATVTADTVVIAAGARPQIPNIAGLADANPLTSDNVMRMESLPASMAILGSGFIAAEMAHIFASLGVEVTLLARSGALLRAEDADVSEAFTKLARERFNVRSNFSTTSVVRDDEGVKITGDTVNGSETIRVEEILVATGRTPNGDLLDVSAAGIDMTDDGRVAVDEYQRVLGGGVPLAGVWALGDVSSRYQLKHVANHEARTVKHNLLAKDENALRASDHRYVPHAVFSHPQIGAVGMSEKQARESGREILVVNQPYASIAYGWAMEDQSGFAKLIADAETTELLGAHIMGPHAPTLIQTLIQAMCTGQSARDIAATQYWIHPAMPELLENALLNLVAQADERAGA